jgi:hypothetical protein
MAESDPIVDLLALGAAGLALLAWQAAKEKRQPPAPAPPPARQPDPLEADAQLARLIRAAMAEAQPEPAPEPSVASFDVSAVGDNVLLAGAPGYRIALYELTLYNTVQQNLELRDASKALLALPNFPAQAGYQLAMQDEPHFVLGYGNSLIVNLGAGRATGFVRYRMLERWGN